MKCLPIVLIVVSSTLAGATELSDSAALASLRTQAERELFGEVVPFWTAHSVDREAGGFITCLDREGKPYDTFKHLWMQWREVYMLASLYNAGYREAQYLRLAERGFEFLFGKCRYPDGRYHYIVDRRGQSLQETDGGQEAFTESFAALGCAALYRATMDGKYRREAESAYAIYRRKTAKGGGRYDLLAYPMIELNVVMTMRQAFGGYDAEIDDCIRRIRRFAHPETGIMYERAPKSGGFELDTQFGRFVTPGHALEGLFFILQRLKEKPDAELKAFVLREVKIMGEFGWDAQDGGIWYNRDGLGLPMSKNDYFLKAWWPQMEAMNAMITAYQLSGDRYYLDFYRKIHDYAEAHLHDAKYGEWFAYAANDGRQFHTYKGSKFKGFFHLPRHLLNTITVIREMEARKDDAPTLHVAGGTEKFRSFLAALGARVESHPSAAELPIERAGANDVFFILPDYAHGRQTVEELPFERLTELRAAMDRGAGFYFENYVTPDAASDGRHADLTGLQVVGRPRHLHQEYLVADFGKGTDLGEILQARDAYYLPATGRSEGVFASVGDCVGTHRVSVPGKRTYPVLARGRTPRVVSGAFDLSRFDPLYRRPRAEWRALVTRMLAAVTGLGEDRIAAAFDAAYPEPLRLSHGTDADAAVRRAVEWHFKSGVMRAADGSKGIFEMIRSNDLGVRKSLRTDVALLTAALLADAGRKYGKPEWTRAGCALADFQLAQGAQAPGGFFRWYAGCDAVYASDSSRDGLALVNLHRATGEKRYRDAALRLGDALVGWLGTNGVCSGCFDLKHGYEGLDLSDNPVFYGEMVPFLLQLGTPRHRAAAERVVDRVMAKFPDVTPFGFSDNFTYSRGLMMLAAAQCLTARDHSEKINRMLDFFLRLRHPCGGIAEAPIRLEENTEAGVGMGDGSDAITDILYCDYVVYGAASILKRLPAARRGSIDLAKVRLLADGLRDFFLATQIASDDPRFDGGWMRAYDMARGEYYGLNRDMDWGSSCIMGGWVMSFVPMFLMNEGADVTVSEVRK